MSKAASTKAKRGRQAAQITAKGAATKSAARSSAAKDEAKTPQARKKARSATTTHKLIWQDVTCRVRHTPDYISKGWTHLELIVVKPKDAPVPITNTGYLSHFLDEDLLAKNGGPVAFFTGWLEREAKSKAWAKTEFRWRQLELFRE